MKVLTYISRILVGSLFVVSGLIKANDTIGFSYKLEEYFENGALAYRVRDWFGWNSFSLEFLMEYALVIAVIMCLAEIVLGFAILFGTKIKFSVYSILSLTILFFFLTLHTATCDPFATYIEVTKTEVGSPDYNHFIERMESNKNIKSGEEKKGVAEFSEDMPVQCVTDCGCFGDAMKGSLGRSLTPWESFTKDLILMIFIIPIFFSRNRIKINTTKEDLIIFLSSTLLVIFYSWVFDWYFPILFFALGYAGYYLSKRALFNRLLKWIPILFVSFVSLIFIYYTLNHLPIRDYRPYAIGKSIPDQMVLPEGAIPDVFDNVFFYKNKLTGEVEEFTEKNYPWDDDNYEFVDRETKLISEGDKPLITDFSIMAEDGNDYAQDYFSEEGLVFLLVAYDITKTNEASFKKINTFVDGCNADGNYFIGLTSSTYNDVEDFRHRNQTMFDFYSCDATTLRTIVRSNPGLVLLRKGEILEKWSFSDIPDYKIIKGNYLK